MNNYIIILKELDDSTVYESRADLFTANVLRNIVFLEKLHLWINEQNMSSEVGSIGEAMCLPCVTLRCTESLSERIKDLPEVETVYRDGTFSK